MAYDYQTGGPVNYGVGQTTGGYGNTQQMPVMNVATNPFGFNEVDGIAGVDRYPVAPGAGVILKDATSDLVFIKARDRSGANLPRRVFKYTEVTEEFAQNEEPVTRKEFKQLQDTMGEIRSMLEFLTSPNVKENGNV